MRPEASNDAHPTSQAQDGDQDHVSMEEEAMWGALPEKPAPQSVPSSRLSRTGVGQPDPVQRDECWYPSELATASPALPLDSLESTRSANAAGNQELALPSSEPRARRSLATPSGVGARAARRATELPPPPQEVFAQLERSAQVRQLPPAPDGPSRSSSVEQLVHSDGMQPGTRRSRRPTVEAKKRGFETLESCAVLGVSPESGLEQIRQQYRHTALQHHPDKGGSSSSFVRLHKAKEYMVARKAAASPSERSSESDTQQMGSSEDSLAPRTLPIYPGRELAAAEPLSTLQGLMRPLRHLSQEMEDSDVEVRNRKTWVRTMSTECPPSRRRTSSIAESTLDVLGAQETRVPVRRAEPECTCCGPGVDNEAGQLRRERSTQISSDDEVSLEALGAVAHHMGRAARSRKALERDVQHRLHAMDHHCEALSLNYQQLALLHGELGDAFSDLRHAWAPLHEVAVQ